LLKEDSLYFRVLRCESGRVLDKNSMKTACNT